MTEEGGAGTAHGRCALAGGGGGVVAAAAQPLCLLLWVLVDCALLGRLQSQTPGRRVFAVLWFLAVWIGMHCLHSLCVPSVFSSSMNVRVSPDVPSGSPWVSHPACFFHILRVARLCPPSSTPTALPWISPLQSIFHKLPV